MFRILLTFLLYCVSGTNCICSPRFICFREFSFCAVASNFAGPHAPTKLFWSTFMCYFQPFDHRVCSIKLRELVNCCKSSLQHYAVVMGYCRHICGARNSDKLALLNKHVLLQIFIILKCNSSLLNNLDIWFP